MSNHSGDSEPDSAKVRIWRASRLFFGDRLASVGALVCVTVVAGFCESAVIALLGVISTALVSRHSTVTISLGGLHFTAQVDQLLLVGVSIALVRVALQGLLSYLPAAICANAQAAMRDNLFGEFTRASWSVQAAEGEGNLQELVTSQVLQATQGVVEATTIVTSGIMLIVLVGSALVIGPVAALVVIGAGLGLALVIRPLNRLGMRQSHQLSTSQLEYAAGIHDAVNVAEEAQVFGVGDAQERRISALVDSARRSYLTTMFLGRIVSGGYQSVVLLLLLVGLAVLNATGAAGHLGSLGAVLLLLVRASSYGQQVQGNYHLMHQSLSFLNQLREAGERYRDAAVVRGTRLLQALPSIAFEEVSYAYLPGVPVLQEVSFQVERGEFIGVVGPTGAGKSTLVQLLLGLRYPQSGSYLVDGEPVQDWSLSGWTRRVAYVPQEPRLFHGTVAENIRFFRDLDDATIESAARQAQIHQEISDWRGGYRTTISQRAKAVSGGQRQRICLARALAGLPFLLVLDEPTSALDPRSESLIQESLAALRGSLTLFVIAHRFSTLSLCDRVMVLRNGRLEAFASGSELARTNSFYQSAASLSYTELLEPSTGEEH
jgi:ABC-type multidrug transport system fused ATPase/permease subunit